MMAAMPHPLAQLKQVLQAAATKLDGLPAAERHAFRIL
jgi:hypothetical protein